MRFSTLKSLAHIDHNLKVEIFRGTSADYILRIISHGVHKHKHKHERMDLLTNMFNNTKHFASIEEIKDYLSPLELEAVYLRQNSAHGEMSGADEHVGKRKAEGGIKIMLH